MPWQFLSLSVLLDWVSRTVVAWLLAETLDSQQGLRLWDRGPENEGILELPKSLSPQSLSDRGPQMRSHRTRRFFARTGIEPLSTRPRTPDDTPEIEALFSTMKGRPDSPGRFERFEQALGWGGDFFRWYTHEPHHRGIGSVTPSQRHAGLHDQVLAERAALKARCLEDRRAFNLNRVSAPAWEAT